MLNIKSFFPNLTRERDRALSLIGELFVDELFVLSSGQMVNAVTGSLRDSIFMDIDKSTGSVTVGYNINKAPHAGKFVGVVEQAFENIQESPQYKKAVAEFIKKGFSK